MVGLDDGADGPAALSTAQTPRSGADPPLNSWQIMPLPPPTAPSITGPPDRRAQGFGHMFRLHVETVDVVEQAVEGLQHHGMFQ